MGNKKIPLPIVTIDGPGGSGKGTIAALLARELGWGLLDSGALYRLTALCAKRHDIDLTDESSLSELAVHLDVQFVPSEQLNDMEVILEGQLVGAELRTEEVGAMASNIATFPAVRKALLQRQWSFAEPPGLVADGRDMGTIVFPDAQLKIFLTAHAEERAKRRVAQLLTKGISGNFAHVLEDIIARDECDINRAIAPLKPAEDAIIIDSSFLGIHDVFNMVMTEINERNLLFQVKI